MKPAIILAVSATVVLSIGWLANQRPMVKVDRCAARFIMLKDGYRVWGVYYCHGFQRQADGSEKHFYHRPVFFHADVEKLLKEGESK